MNHVAVLAVVALVAVVALTDRMPRQGRRTQGASGAPRAWQRAEQTATARWASTSELAPLVVAPGASGRLLLGTAARGRGARLLAAERAQSVAVVGPTQSGKTSCVAVPAILSWEGPVLAASIKTDLVSATGHWRRSCGTVWCFDPAGDSGLPASPWSPLPAARTWPGARRLASDLTEVGRAGDALADGDFWYALAAKLLAALLFAAATGGRDMADVQRWVDTQEVGEVAMLLERAGDEAASLAAQASWVREERQRSSVYATVESVLVGFAEPGALGTPGVPAIDVVRLLEGNNTLYLCAPAHDQRRLRSLFSALTKQVLETAFSAAARRGAPLDPPLLVVLDEAANITPLAELDSLAATCAGHGIQLVTVWQDLSQISARYGPRAPTVLNNHRARLFLPGIADPATLDHASHLVGEEQRWMASESEDGRGTWSRSRAPVRAPLLPPDALRRLDPHTALLVYGALAPARVRLVPWWQHRWLASRGTAQEPRRGATGTLSPHAPLRPDRPTVGKRSVAAVRRVARGGKAAAKRAGVLGRDPPR